MLACWRAIVRVMSGAALSVDARRLSCDFTNVEHLSSSTFLHLFIRRTWYESFLSARVCECQRARVCAVRLIPYVIRMPPPRTQARDSIHARDAAN
ncbi:hypothetical protein EON66_11380 [archaeon]|nr:MAG: hypothetical protein EON66_11380 [archaeon]